MSSPLRQVEADTDLCRAPGLWSVLSTGEATPIEVKGTNAVIRATSTLALTPDFDILAWICRLWKHSPDRREDGVVGFTIYELGKALYGCEPSGEHHRTIRESLRRLKAVEVEFLGVNTIDLGKPAAQSLDNIIERLVSDRETIGPSPNRKPGEIRGSTFQVQLAPWLREGLLDGKVTYLDFATLRRLDGVAKRVWIYLEAERYKAAGGGVSETSVGLGTPALACLGVDTYARHRDARRALDRAGERIVEADSRYQSVEVVKRLGYTLVARRRDAEARKVAEAARGSLSGEPEGKAA